MEAIDSSEIKEEPSLIHEEINIDIKNEEDEFSETNNENFDNVKAEIKEEIPITTENESEITENHETEAILPINSEELKDELQEQEEMDLVSYDYPNFEDSMDSSEAAALSQVEACLSDKVSVKSECDSDKDFDEKPDYLQIKEESDITVTETHVISNKVINTEPAVPSILPGEMPTRALIMEIHPANHNDEYNKINPEEILPTTSKTYSDDYDDTFQLNSITGNILSLEQEAYSLLETKNIKENCIVCPKCPKTFRTKDSYRRHMKIHDSIERRAMGLLKGLKTREENKKKREMVVKEEFDTSEEHNVDNSEDSYTCTCGQVFQRRSRMETCLRSHTLFTDSLYTCSTCDKKYKSKSELISHRNRQHKKKFPCKFCPTDYDNQKALFKHLQAHQKVQLTEFKVISETAKGSNELNCVICNQTFSNLTDLKLHVMQQHKEPYMCEFCSEITFSKITEFIEHMKSLHPDVNTDSILNVLEAFSKLIKAWKCEECGLQFYEADKLALHQIEHFPELKSDQNSQCPVCYRIFISAQGLKSHNRMHHPKEVVEKVEPEEVGVLCLECRKVCKDMPALSSHMRLHSMDRKYPCKYCDFRFATPQKRKIHSEIHTGDMKYVCFICEYQCSSENRLKQHKMSLKHLNMKEYLLTGKPLVEDEPAVKKTKVKDKKKIMDVVCDICGEQFVSEEDMDQHKSTHPFIEFPNEENPTRIFFK